MTNLEKYIAAFEECLEVSGDQLETLEYQGVGSWDSVGHMSLMAALEDAFDITIPAVEVVVENFNSVDGLTAMVKRLVEDQLD